ncbi:hypothetical protein JX265_005780 [Neoarthrinium moseri]|uniref:SSCRP protein n=1 Tax=Neoarthrinium moseri TaxID=1658444 RepID=A0A9P9WN92_9PEZI|nr:hypothetical protein JX265_005780 [Neoarthrinium moseri]
MQFNIGSIVFLGVAAFGSLASAQAVAFGQELRNGDQTNHWVAWTEGQHACPGQQVLDVLTKSPCGQSFSLGEVSYSFSGCSADSGAPTVLLDSGGLQIGGCKTASGKINCHGDNHDIIKHGVCAIVN